MEYPQEKNVYSTASPPSYPAGAGAPFVPGGAPQQAGTPPVGFAAAPYPQAGTPQQIPYQQTGTPQQFAQPGQQPMYSPQPQVIVAQPVMMGGMGGRVQNLASYAAPCLCPNCGQTQVTRVTYETGSHTHLWAIILGVLFCCCCIPYMVDGLKDVRHNCSNCGIPLAIWHRSGGLEVLAHQGTNVPMQAQATGVPQQQLQPQQTGAPMQPQYTGAPPIQTPPGQFTPQHTGQQPAYTGPAHP